MDCFADDTGLEVEALKRRTGVTRHAMPETDIMQTNMLKLLHAMEGIENRKAQFRTAFALIIDGKSICLKV